MLPTLVNGLFTTFLLGLFGSLGHCVGMCGPVSILLTRPARAAGLSSRRLALWMAPLHVGRLTTYALLGAAVTLLGHLFARLVAFLSTCVAPGSPSPSGAEGHDVALFRYAQGGIALVLAAAFLYMSLATLGKVPPVETLLGNLTSRWGQAVRAMTRPATGRSPWRPFALGLVWGMLPCGLVYSALLIASTAGSPWQGGLVMLAFGVGTVPATVATGWLGTRGGVTLRQGARTLAALLILLFGVQMALRGLAAWGLVGHFRVGPFMLW